MTAVRCAKGAIDCLYAATSTAALPPFIAGTSFPDACRGVTTGPKHPRSATDVLRGCDMSQMLEYTMNPRGAFDQNVSTT
jgi:hypothetical protein